MTDITLPRAELEQVLEALENLQGLCTDAQDGWVEAVTIWTPEIITALRERLAQPEQDWDWRHPKAQALIGAKARLEIKLRLVEQLVEDPNFETTASDMEYWEPLHDKLQGRLAQPEQEPVAWTPIKQPYPLEGKLDILMGDGSILCGVIPQEEGDLWWSGTAEKFIDPQYYDITHWRIHCDTAAIRARGQDPMPLFDDWNKDWNKDWK